MGGVYRRLAYLLAWAMAATVTVSVAGFGIRSALSAAVPTRTVPLSSLQLRRVVPLASPTVPAPAQASPGSPVGSQSIGSQSIGSAVASSAETWVKDGAGFRRVFHTIGGDVDFFTGTGAVQVVSNTPRPGYTVTVTRYAVDSIMVSFFSNRKTSRVWARWWNGPYAEVTESVT
ncbi:MAG: hypothetical protein QOI74_3615 [Micromonosporaceae bacterium]|jgi:hypothetical protein|nr:hypothetical protein [Micromonosporaceae bacterium]